MLLSRSSFASILQYVVSDPSETNRLLMAYGTEPFAVIHFDVRFESRKVAVKYMGQVRVG